jgi:hypothetical protein
MIFKIENYTVIVDKENYDRIKAQKWKVLCAKGGYIYFYCCIARKVILLHRFILNASSDMQVDHKNGDTLDNRKSNLRVCLKIQNLWNRKKHRNNTSGYKGVIYLKNHKKWMARISVNRKRLFLGLFETPIEAHRAYCVASKKYHGNFGRTV